MDMVLEKKLIVKDVPQMNPCQKCKSCIRLRLLELGIVSGQKVKIKKLHQDLWTLSLIDNSGNSYSTFGVRKEEAERILFEDDCVINLQ